MATRRATGETKAPKSKAATKAPSAERVEGPAPRGHARPPNRGRNPKPSPREAEEFEAAVKATAQAVGAKVEEKRGHTSIYGHRNSNASTWKPGQCGNPNGRPKGRPNYQDVLTVEDRAKLATEAGCTPLQFMMSVMLDRTVPLPMRLEAAVRSAPYMHRKMPVSVELPSGPTTLDVQKLLALPADERERLLATLKQLGVLADPTATPRIAAEIGPATAQRIELELTGRTTSPAHVEMIATPNDRTPRAATPP